MKSSCAPRRSPLSIAAVLSLAALITAPAHAAPPVTVIVNTPGQPPTVYTQPATALPAGEAPHETPQPQRPRRKRGRFSRMIARLQLGVRPSYSNLLSAKSRDTFGSGGFSIKPSYFRLRVPTEYNEWGWDYGLTRRKYEDNRMTMITVGAGYQHNFNVADALDPEATDEEKRAWRASLESYPYVGVGLDLVGTKLRVPSENLDTDFKLGLGATLTAGYQYKTRFRLQSSVTAQTSVAGYNFSSARVALDYKM